MSDSVPDPDSITWEEPPAKSRPAPERMARLIARLKERPGEWAKLGSDYKTANAGSPYKRHGIEIVTRRQPDGNFAIYARWPAPESGPS